MIFTNFIIIDDDQTYCQVLARSLQKLGKHAVHFSCPESALPVVQQTTNPLILLDLKLNDDSGLRWIERLRRSNKSCYLILLTGYASISTAVEAIKLGADDYLAKPVTARQIVQHIERQESRGTETQISDKPMSVDRLEWEHIQKVLTDNEGNISASARALGMHRRTLQRKLAKKPVKT